MKTLKKTVTVAERFQRYDKETLKKLAIKMGLAGVYKYKKDELVKVLTDKFLEPEVMFYRAAILTDKEITILERGINGPVTYNSDEYHEIANLHGRGFIIVADGKYIVPSDVAATWKRIKNDKFRAYQKKSSWVWECVNWAENMYALTPDDIMLEVVNVKKDMHFKRTELLEIFNHFPQDILWSIHHEDMFMQIDYLDDMDTLEDIWFEQKEKDYYIPTAAEVLELYETGGLISGKEYQKMKTVLINEMGMDREEADDLLYELWDMVAYDDDLNETMKWFLHQVSFKNINQLNKVVGLLTSLMNSTRMLMNRGHKPIELLKNNKYKE